MHQYGVIFETNLQNNAPPNFRRIHCVSGISTNALALGRLRNIRADAVLFAMRVIRLSGLQKGVSHAGVDAHGGVGKAEGQATAILLSSGLELLFFKGNGRRKQEHPSSTSTPCICAIRVFREGSATVEREDITLSGIDGLLVHGKTGCEASPNLESTPSPLSRELDCVFDSHGLFEANQSETWCH